MKKRRKRKKNIHHQCVSVQGLQVLEDVTSEKWPQAGVKDGRLFVRLSRSDHDREDDGIKIISGRAGRSNVVLPSSEQIFGPLLWHEGAEEHHFKSQI